MAQKPLTVTLVRHGQSESNVINGLIKSALASGASVEEALALAPLHVLYGDDREFELTQLGRMQAVATGDWLRASSFDTFYTSPYRRAYATAEQLRLTDRWSIDERLSERSWGGVSLNITPDGSHVLTEADLKEREEAPWTWKPAGGESLATVAERFNGFLQELSHAGRKHLLAVTHGEAIAASKLVLEEHTPESWFELQKASKLRIENAFVLQYARVHPETGELYESYRFRRGVCPWVEARSWYAGEWTEVKVS